MRLKPNIHAAFEFSFRFLPHRAALKSPDMPRQDVTHFVTSRTPPRRKSG
jgi:hypothetical protein